MTCTPRHCVAWGAYSIGYYRLHRHHRHEVPVMLSWIAWRNGMTLSFKAFFTIGGGFERFGTLLRLLDH